MISEILAAIGGAAAAKTIDYLYRRRNQRLQDIDKWYEDSISLISRGHGICLSARDRSNLNYGDISTESKKMSLKLKEKTNPYPKRIDEESAIMVNKLSILFRKLSAVTETTEDQSTEESINEIFEMGQREYSEDNNLDMGQAVDESTNYSSIMEDFFIRSGLNPQIFGSRFEEEFKDAESIDELINRMKPELATSEKLLEKSIESHISDEWDESLSLGVRVLLQITSNLCREAINHISEENNMNIAN